MTPVESSTVKVKSIKLTSNEVLFVLFNVEHNGARDRDFGQ